VHNARQRARWQRRAGGSAAAPPGGGSPADSGGGRASGASSSDADDTAAACTDAAASLPPGTWAAIAAEAAHAGAGFHAGLDANTLRDIRALQALAAECVALAPARRARLIR
jgi:hypothetical protein